MSDSRKKFFIFGSILVLVVVGVLGLAKPLPHMFNQLATVLFSGLGDEETIMATEGSNLVTRDNGEVQLTGVNLESKDGSRLVVSGDFGTEVKTFIIDTDGETILRGGESVISLDVLTSGAKLTIDGIFQSFTPFVILAKEIRARGLTETLPPDFANLPKPPPRKIAILSDSPAVDSVDPNDTGVNDVNSPEIVATSTSEQSMTLIPEQSITATSSVPEIATSTTETASSSPEQIGLPLTNLEESTTTEATTTEVVPEIIILPNATTSTSSTENI